MKRAILPSGGGIESVFRIQEILFVILQCCRIDHVDLVAVVLQNGCDVGDSRGKLTAKPSLDGGASSKTNHSRLLQAIYI